MFLLAFLTLVLRLFGFEAGWYTYTTTKSGDHVNSIFTHRSQPFVLRSTAWHNSLLLRNIATKDGYFIAGTLSYPVALVWFEWNPWAPSKPRRPEPVQFFLDRMNYADMHVK